MHLFSRVLIGLLAFAAASPLAAGTLASGTITIDGTELITSANRVFRNGVASTFSVPKAFPGTNICGGVCGFRTVTVTPQNPNVTVTLAGGLNPLNVFVVGYLNSFNVASLATNYLGDGGVSGTPVTFQVTVPAGNQLVLVFMNTTNGATGSVNFTISDPSTGIPTLSSLGLIALAVLLTASAGFAIRQAHA